MTSAPRRKQTAFTRLSANAYAYTAKGDPNAGMIVGEDAAMVFDATATPADAEAMIAQIHEVTDVPIRHVALSHYHAVRVLGVSAFLRAGARDVIASRGTAELIGERGEADRASEIGRLAHLFEGLPPGEPHPTPTLTFDDRHEVDLGGVTVELIALGRGHTRGDTVAWIPSQRICFAGDLVEANTGVYTGDAYVRDWSATLDRLRALGPEQLVPGRGPALRDAASCEAAMAFTQSWLETLTASVGASVAAGQTLKGAFDDARRVMDPLFGHVFIYRNCIPFGVARAYDEANGIADPQIWTAERDQDLWRELDFRP